MFEGEDEHDVYSDERDANSFVDGDGHEAGTRRTVTADRRVPSKAHEEF